MEFFEKIGKQASKTYKEAAEKTGKIAKETKLRMLVSSNKVEIAEIYEKIGRKIYEKHIRENVDTIKIKDEISEECSEIDVLADEIELARKEILNLKDKKQCNECYYEIDIEHKYCPNCGEKQEDEDIKEQKNNEEIKSVEDLNDSDFIEISNNEIEDENIDE